MMHTTIVRAYLVEGSVPLSRTHVELYRNQAEPAELIGSASTDARGEATFRYPAVTPFTVVAVVRNRSGTAVRTIRVKPSANRPFLRIDVPIELALARRLGLVGIKKGRSTERKKADLAAFLRKRTGPGSDPGPGIELCLARMALDMVAGVGDRATPLQKRLALYAEQQLGSGPADLARIAQFAERGRAVLDEVGPPGLQSCSGDSGIAHLANQLASRLSAYRYHRVLFLAERTPLGANSTSTERLSSEVGDTGITEVFRSRALGGEYRFELVCEVD